MAHRTQRSQCPPAKSLPSSGDWEAHVFRIKELYLVENKTLKDVMYIMEKEYGFRATYVTSYDWHTTAYTNLS
jgi:hypothetical protein